MMDGWRGHLCGLYGELDRLWYMARRHGPEVEKVMAQIKGEEENQGGRTYRSRM